MFNHLRLWIAVDLPGLFPETYYLNSGLLYGHIISGSPSLKQRTFHLRSLRYRETPQGHCKGVDMAQKYQQQEKNLEEHNYSSSTLSSGQLATFMQMYTQGM